LEPSNVAAVKRSSREQKTTQVAPFLGSPAHLTLLVNSLSRMVKPLKGRETGGSQFIPIEPGYDADDIDGSSDPNLLQMRLVQANVARATQAEGSHALRNGGLDPLTQPLLLSKRWCLLLLTGGLQRLMLGLWTHGQQAPRCTRGGMGTGSYTRTVLTVFGREADLDPLVFPMVNGWRPTATRMSLGTGRLLLIPITTKSTAINALVSVGLPLDISTSRTNHFDPVLRLAC